LTTYLLDTHVLLWTALDSPSLSPEARGIIADPAGDVLFSVASILEIVIKSGLGRQDFLVDAARLRQRAVNAGFGELPIRAPHVLAVGELPSIHSDPFDRILLAQARIEGFTFLTGDEKLVQYGSPVRRV
jgi:PIN domain nuclease of toxin-antitoxin system